MQTGIIEGLGKFDIDGTADRARRQGRIRRLHNIHLADKVRANGAEVEGTTGSAGNLAAIIERLDELRSQAPNGDRSCVTGRRGHAADRRGAAADGDARNMLQSSSDIDIGELADIFGGNR